jgi:predicted amidohydrolase YtcJ
MSIRILWPALAASLALAGACSKSRVETIAPRDVADTIYVGGNIITINDSQPAAEALAVKDGKILAVGTRADVESGHRGDATKVVELAGKTLLPGFLDAHSHYVSALSVANQAKVYAPPAGPGKDVPSIIAAIEQFRAERGIPKGQLIQAYGYDDTVMPDGRLLNRDDLDRAFPDNPVLVGHVSMHDAVLNAAAMKRWNVSSATKTPPGGMTARKPGTNEPYGLIMETAYLLIFASLPRPTKEQEVEWSKAGQMLFA